MYETFKKILRPVYVPIANWHYRMFTGPKRYHHLTDTVNELKANNILEIGVWNGRRAIKMIEVAQKAGAKPVYFGFDLFEALDEASFKQELSKRPPALKEVKERLEATGAEIRLFAGNTHETLPKMVGDLPQMDFIFIDGGHSNETVANDWLYCSKLMHDKTVVIFDDYWRNRTDGGCRTLIDSLDRDQYRVEILPEIDCFDNPEFGRLEISFARVTLA